MKHPVYDTDLHFTIDPTTRALVSQMKKLTLVQGSHNSERFTFDFPRMVEGHDLSLCDLAEVHFLNIEAITKETSPGTFRIEDVQVCEDDDQKITFSWLIDGRATKFGGTMSFSIHFKCMDEGKLLYRWPTAVFSGILISDGIDHSDALLEDYTDIVTAWMNEIEQSIDATVSGAVDKAVEELVGEAVDKAVDATVGGAVDKAIEDALRESPITTSDIANAITGYASGTSIHLDNISPLTSKVKVGVVGKQPPEIPAMMMMRSATPTSEGLVNLIPFVRSDGKLGYHDAAVGESATFYGVTFLVNADGSITASGTPQLQSGQIMLTFKLYDNETDLASFEGGKYYTVYVDKGKSEAVDVKCNSYKPWETILSTDGVSSDAHTGILESTATGVYLYVTAKGGYGEINTTIYPMIVEGENVSITEYVPPQGATADGGNHTHIDADYDHFCDICGERLSACVDNNKDHYCDICGEPMEGEAGRCVDENKDHECDYCGWAIPDAPHADKDGDHLCDYCGGRISECEDADGDGICDICGAQMHTCIDENPKDHVCDICGRGMKEAPHFDYDGDGLCDYCGEPTPFHNCVDNDKDHYCDICDEPMEGEAGNHEDTDKDHKCDYCGGTGFGVHADEDGDGFCDYCGEPIIAVTLKIASADDPDTVIETVKTTYGAVVELTPIFPSMVITTDKDDAILSAEYNKDTNAVIAELRDAIGEGGGGVTDADKEAIKEEIKADLGGVIGDIDAALDAIIAKQTEVLGGDS